MHVTSKVIDTLDGSAKFLIENDGGHRFEGVYLPDPRFYGYCTSTQVGCNMKCTFCATGRQRNKHNLTADEIVRSIELMEEQVDDPKPLDFVTLSGMGEPLANYDNALDGLERLRERYPSITVTSISTIGLRHGLDRLVRERRRIRVYVSLHAADDALRSTLIPLAVQHPIGELLDTLSAYGEINGPDNCRVSYLLLGGVNDAEADLDKLIAHMRGRPLKLQLLLWNHVDGFDFQRVPDALAEHWRDSLRSEGIDAYMMPSLGRTIGAACGQLSARALPAAA